MYVAEGIIYCRPTQKNLMILRIPHRSLQTICCSYGGLTPNYRLATLTRRMSIEDGAMSNTLLTSSGPDSWRSNSLPLNMARSGFTLNATLKLETLYYFPWEHLMQKRPLRLIVDMYPGNDGHVRSVRVKTQSWCSYWHTDKMSSWSTNYITRDTLSSIMCPWLAFPHSSCGKTFQLVQIFFPPLPLPLPLALPSPVMSIAQQGFEYKGTSLQLTPLVLPTT